MESGAPLIPPSSSSHHQHPADMMLREDGGGGGGSGTSAERQQITIFYNGKMSVCEVTEHQARVIIMFAVASTTSLNSMKISLQQFLQRRKHRRILPTTSPHLHPPL